MAFLVFALSLVLLAAGVAGGYMSLDLLPTSAGVLYALGGVVAACMAVVTFALGVMIRRVDALAELVRLQAGAHGVAEPAPVEQQSFMAPAVDAEPSEEGAEAQDAGAEESAEHSAADAEEPVNENRSGRLPTLGEIEHALGTPEAPPSLIGRYSSGGANYMIFADGSIEAETQEGTFKFASMGDFKQYLSDRKDGRR
jgi:hypothetical protein